MGIVEVCTCINNTDPGSVQVPGDNKSDNHQNIQKSYSNKDHFYVNENNIKKLNIDNKKETLNENYGTGISKMKSLLESKLKKYVEILNSQKFNEHILPQIKKIDEILGPINITEKTNCLKNDSQLIELDALLFLNNKFIYNGTWNISCQKDGWGILIDSNGNKYEGGWKNDKFSGYGRLISINGNWYQGKFNNGLIDGNGKYHDEKITYVGNFKNNLFEGFGQEICTNEYIYEGNYKNGKKDGYGKIIFNDNNFYEGNFLKNKFHGKGIFKWTDGRKYNGNWVENKMSGEGEFIWDEYTKYIGEYKDGRREGFGTYYYHNNYYEGKWLNNLPHGEGRLFENDENIQGLFRYGKLLRIKNPHSDLFKLISENNLSSKDDEKISGKNKESTEKKKNGNENKNYLKKKSSKNNINIKDNQNIKRLDISKEVKNGFLERIEEKEQY